MKGLRKRSSTAEPCGEFADLLPMHAAGLLDKADADHVREHLLKCPLCRSELDEWRVAALATRAALGSQPKTPASHQLFERILTEVKISNGPAVVSLPPVRVAAPRRLPQRRPAFTSADRRPRWTGGAIKVAAVLLLLTAAFFGGSSFTGIGFSAQEAEGAATEYEHAEFAIYSFGDDQASEIDAADLIGIIIAAGSGQSWSIADPARVLAVVNDVRDISATDGAWVRSTITIPAGKATTTALVNFRSGPSPDARLIRTIVPDSDVQLTGKGQNGFLEAACGEQIGWIYGAYIAPEEGGIVATKLVDQDSSLKPGDKLVVTADEPLMLRADPNAEAAILGHMSPGAEVSLLEGPTTGSWYRVAYEGVVGWAFGAYLAVSEGAGSSGVLTGVAPSAVSLSVKFTPFATADRSSIEQGHPVEGTALYTLEVDISPTG